MYYFFTDKLSQQLYNENVELFCVFFCLQTDEGL